ncbi:serine/threonine-protein kinase 11-interacting protein isoform X2 [Schistocerca gregaria]|uniref:serine/threonine-protein kinase 11-interacting protein isoform X2 n=1 Tax=Schistocerca gregaria TaxID=7010 RepID=UPI00211EC490|nr:serine/threonine-protein kinase 11-interacting protein isoform X2 [Schistocerca gregaria]
MCDIQKLVNLLRENVDAISSGHSLLVLTVPVLQKLNESFVLINEQAPNSKDAAVQVPADAIVEQRLLDDLAFLLRLVRRTPGLRLVSSGACHPGEEPRSAAVSVEHFHSLRHLVLHKVRLCDVRGLSTLAPRLTSLCCDSDPQQLLAGAGSWPQLRTATFCRAGVSAVPAQLAAAALVLAVLDLGHNRLSDTAGADFSAFRSLSRLGLAYNAFEAVPSELPPSLTALGLACNYVDTIDGVSRLESLVELDLSGNCLAAHSCLAPLSWLPALRRLDLRGNPLAFHPRHRVLAAAELHSAALTCEFVLDGQHLSQSERAVGLSGKREGRSGGRTSSASAEREPPPPVPAGRLPPPPEDSLSTASSTASDKTLVADGTTPGRRQSTAGGDGSRTAPMRKSRHVRKAVISDLEAADPTDDGSLTGSVTSIRSSPPDSNAEHLETKRRVESLRQMFGHDNWLHSQGGTFLQDVLGLPPTATTASALLGGTAPEPEPEPAAAPAGPAVVDSAVAEVDSVEVVKEGNSNTFDDSCEHTLSSEEENGQREEEEIIPPADDEEEADESEQQLYSVRRLLSAVGKQQQMQQQELFLAVTDRQLKERDTATGRLLCRWQLEALQSCELLSVEPARIRVTFDTIKPDRRERTYFVEDAKDAQHLLQTLRAILDERPLQANNLSVFRCMKCSSQFSEEVESPLVPDPRLDGTLRCPNCGSAVVVQAEEDPQPDPQPLPRPTGAAPPSRRRADTRAAVSAAAPAPEDPPLAYSPSQSSIGSAASLDALGEPSASAAPSGSGSGGPRRCESDIEIISNPSQSSIEVLDGSGARTPGRKRSSEERQVAPHGFPVVAGPQVAAPPLLPTLPPPMTESSSSDSLTDSVCTAYEGRAPASAPAPAAAAAAAAALTASLQATGPGPQVAEPAASPPALSSAGAPRRAAPRPDATPRPGVPLSDVPQYSYVDFGWADHRIKLHLYVSVFQHRDEELTTLVKGHVLCKNLTQPKPALVVLSTHKVYLLYITRQESDEPRRWLVPADAWPLRQLREVRVLPWGQGVSLLLSPTGSTPAAAALLLLLYDADHTSALFAHLAGLSLGDGCRVEGEPLEQHTDAVRRLAATPDRPDDNVRVAAFFVAASVVTDSGTVSLGSGMLAIGESALSLSTDSLLWLLPSSGKLPELWAAQSISNLVEVEVDGETVTPVFLDESSGTARETRWVLRMGSAAVVSALLDALRPPWEQLFSLPLQVSLSGQSR